MNPAVCIRFYLIAAIALSPAVAAAQSLEQFDADYLESPPGGPDLAEAEQIVVERTNQLRREEGLDAVSPNERLAETASYFAAYMATSGEYGHTADGNKPSERASLFDYQYCIVSENIAKQFDSTGFTVRELGQDFYEGWLNSPGHRKNMVDPSVTETAVAIAVNPQSETYYAVQMFGRPRSAAYRFQVTNRSDQAVSYEVAVAGEASGSKRKFDLPPLATRTHLRCRPPIVDWQWTPEADEVRIDSAVKLTINSDDGDLTVQHDKLRGSNKQLTPSGGEKSSE